MRRHAAARSREADDVTVHSRMQRTPHAIARKAEGCQLVVEIHWTGDVREVEVEVRDMQTGTTMVYGTVDCRTYRAVTLGQHAPIEFERDFAAWSKSLLEALEAER